MPAKDFFKEIGKRQLTNQTGITQIIMLLFSVIQLVFVFLEFKIAEKSTLIGLSMNGTCWCITSLIYISPAIFKNAVYKELNLGSVIEITIAFGKIIVQSEGYRITVKTSIITNIEENKKWIYLSCYSDCFGVFGNSICVPKNLFENEKSIEKFKAEFLQQKQ